MGIARRFGGAGYSIKRVRMQRKLQAGGMNKRMKRRWITREEEGSKKIGGINTKKESYSKRKRADIRFFKKKAATSFDI